MIRYRSLAAAAVLALTLPASAVTAFANADPTEPCVPKDATTEIVIVTPAVPGIPEVPAVPGTPAVPAVPEVPAIPAVAEVWANWSPNKDQGPFEGPPAYPTDPRGTWHVHTKIPGGHEGPDGVYQRDQGGNGRSDWFYRRNAVAGVPAVPGTPAIPAVPGTPAIPAVPAVPAVTQTVVHPAVVCTTETPTPTPTVSVVVPSETPAIPTPVVETETVTPTPTPTVVLEPTKTPEPKPTPKPDKPVRMIECIDGVFVVTLNGEVLTENGSCVERTANTTPVPLEEQGL